MEKKRPKPKVVRQKRKRKKKFVAHEDTISTAKRKKCQHLRKTQKKKIKLKKLIVV
jgi:hypothetical protein